MKIAMADARPILAAGRVFLMGSGVGSIEATGTSYRDEAVVHIQQDIRLEPYTTFWGGSGTSLVTMGAFSYTLSPLSDLVSVGRYSSLAVGLKVMGASHPHEWASTSPVFYNQRIMMQTFAADHGVSISAQNYGYRPGPITIGNDVWVGENVTLGHGVAIGDGAVVASNAVVTRDVEPYTVVGGLPARKIRDRFDAATVSALQESAWWNYAPHDITDIDVSKPLGFAHAVKERRALGRIKPYSPTALSYSDFSRQTVTQ